MSESHQQRDERLHREDESAAPVQRVGSYIDTARSRGASYFDLGEVWDRATPTERIAANQHFLDVIIGRRETVHLSVDLWRIEPDSFTAAEIRYFRKHDYVWADGGRTLAPPSSDVSE